MGFLDSLFSDKSEDKNFSKQPANSVGATRRKC